jgi:hypothetical protein
MNGLEPSAMGLAIAALLTVFLVMKELVIPKWKERKANGGDSMGNHVQDGRLFCQAGRYEERISRLEEHDVGLDRDLARLEKKVDRAVDQCSTIAGDLRYVRSIVDWMKKNGSKRESD